MTQSLVIIHERLGTWARQLRPRLAGLPVQWLESRSSASLIDAARLSTGPILLIDLGDSPLKNLDDLGQAMHASPSALSLVLDPSHRPEVAEIAREFGATLVLSGVVVPPVVENLLRRWIPLSIRRIEREGWSNAIDRQAQAPI